MFETTTFTTERLRMRPLTALDAAALFEVFSDPEVMRYWSCAPWTELKQADEYIDNATQDLAAGSMLRVAIEVAASGKVVGQLALHHFDEQNRRCEIGYALGRAAWGKGYMTEAITSMLDHAFAELPLNRIEADVDPRNAASMQALARLGFVHEGLLRERWIVAGEVCDTAFYGLLKSDWDARPR
ncbi:GNAT family N-acetyltransferase [Massilia eurypsychrophila]